MKFFITSSTYESDFRSHELIKELRHIFSDKVEEKYAEINLNIGIVFRCYLKTPNKRSFTRYIQKDNDLTIDVSFSTDSFKNLYVIERRFEFGKIFLEWLEAGLSNKNLLKNNPYFNKENFMNDILDWGKEAGWFVDEVDYSQDLYF